MSAQAATGAGTPADKTVVISWVEESHHRQFVRVPLDFDPDECDLENDLAQLDPDGFEWLDRMDIEVEDVEYDAAAQYFDPPRYDDSPAPAEGINDAEQVMIPGKVWAAFLEQEMQLDQEHPGDVSLAGVLTEIRKLMAEHTRDADPAA